MNCQDFKKQLNHLTVTEAKGSLLHCCPVYTSKCHTQVSDRLISQWQTTSLFRQLVQCLLGGNVRSSL